MCVTSSLLVNPPHSNSARRRARTRRVAARFAQINAYALQKLFRKEGEDTNTYEVFPFNVKAPLFRSGTTSADWWSLAGVVQVEGSSPTFEVEWNSLTWNLSDSDLDDGKVNRELKEEARQSPSTPLEELRAQQEIREAEWRQACKRQGPEGIRRPANPWPSNDIFCLLSGIAEPVDFSGSPVNDSPPSRIMIPIEGSEECSNDDDVGSEQDAEDDDMWNMDWNALDSRTPPESEGWPVEDDTCKATTAALDVETDLDSPEDIRKGIEAVAAALQEYVNCMGPQCEYPEVSLPLLDNHGADRAVDDASTSLRSNEVAGLEEWFIECKRKKGLELDRPICPAPAAPSRETTSPMRVNEMLFFLPPPCQNCAKCREAGQTCRSCEALIEAALDPCNVDLYPDALELTSGCRLSGTAKASKDGGDGSDPDAADKKKKKKKTRRGELKTQRWVQRGIEVLTEHGHSMRYTEFHGKVCGARLRLRKEEVLSRPEFKGCKGDSFIRLASKLECEQRHEGSMRKYDEIRMSETVTQMMTIEEMEEEEAFQEFLDGLMDDPPG